jgi:hypothetical protein
LSSSRRSTRIAYDDIMVELQPSRRCNADRAMPKKGRPCRMTRAVQHVGLFC